MKVVIYGGGNIAHSLVAKLAMQMPVSVVTHHAYGWSDVLQWVQDGVVRQTRFRVSVHSDVRHVSDADIVFITVPQFAYAKAVDELCATLKRGATVAFVPAPADSFLYVERFRACGVRAVAFQRVPYISRVMERGKSVGISSDRDVHRFVVSDADMQKGWGKLCSEWFGGCAEYMSSFRIFALNNSNPILHPSRMAVLFEGWRHRHFAVNPLFYAEWTDESSELYLSADEDMLRIAQECPDIDVARDYVTVRAHYGVETASELTTKLRSIASFKAIMSPMVECSGKWVPDFNSRYFTEDVDCGLASILQLANEKSVHVPAIQGLMERMSEIRTGDI